MVSYEREAFIFEPGNVRITVDRRLSAYMVVPGFPAEMTLHVRCIRGVKDTGGEIR